MHKSYIDYNQDTPPYPHYSFLPHSSLFLHSRRTRRPPAACAAGCGCCRHPPVTRQTSVCLPPPLLPPKLLPTRPLPAASATPLGTHRQNARLAPLTLGSVSRRGATLLSQLTRGRALPVAHSPSHPDLTSASLCAHFLTPSDRGKGLIRPLPQTSLPSSSSYQFIRNFYAWLSP